MVRTLTLGLLRMRWNWISRPQEGGQSLGKYWLSCATLPPKVGILLHEDDLVPQLGGLEGGGDAAEPSADHQYRVGLTLKPP